MENQGSDDELQPIRLADLYPTRQKFEYGDKVWGIRSPLELDLPEISKADSLGRQIQKDLTLFREGKYKPDDPDGVDLDLVMQNLRQFTRMLVPDMPDEVLEGMKWMEHLLVLGLWQRSDGQDFLRGRLGELLPPSEAKPPRAPIRNGKKPRTSPMQQR